MMCLVETVLKMSSVFLLFLISSCVTKKLTTEPKLLKQNSNLKIYSLPNSIIYDAKNINSSKNIIGISGYYIEINEKKFDFIVPDTRDSSINCSNVELDFYRNLNGEKKIAIYEQACSDNKATCEELQIEEIFPFHSLEKWGDIYDFDISFNTNWFKVEDGVPYPHIYPCSTPYGYVISAGNIIHKKEENTPALDLLATLEEDTSKLMFVDSSNISTYINKVYMGFSGVILARNGKIIDKKLKHPFPLPSQKTKRIAIGKVANGNFFIFAV